MRRHLILLGLSGAGKTTVGRRVAAVLGGPFCDLDACVEVLTGMTVTQLFDGRGEAAFRSAERDALDQVLAGVPQVVAAGGGWAAQPGNLERVAARAVIVHLACLPETAAGRLAGTEDRPLLAGDMIGQLHRLQAERAPFYARADATVDTEARTVQEVADAVVVLARSVGGW